MNLRLLIVSVFWLSVFLVVSQLVVVIHAAAPDVYDFDSSAPEGLEPKLGGQKISAMLIMVVLSLVSIAVVVWRALGRATHQIVLRL